MRIKRSVKICFVLIIIASVLAVLGIRLYLDKSSHFSKEKKINKTVVTEDTIINNLSSKDISDLVGNEPLIIEDNEVNPEEEVVAVSKTEQKDDSAPLQNKEISEDTNISKSME
jgi:Ca2+/Na+ antiporter